MALREFDSVKVGDQLPEKVIPLTRSDLVTVSYTHLTLPTNREV